LRLIKGCAERAANLTRQLLLFSHKQVMQPCDLDLNELVASLSKMLERLIEENVQLELNLHPTPLSIHVDASMIDQVLMNLAVNARDSMPNGGRLVISTSRRKVTKDAVGLQPDAVPGNYVCLSVSDTGTGIHPEVLPRIFEPFFTTKGQGKGTGLGLATVFGIVKQHHGWITVASELNRGTTFQIFLPAAKVASTEVARIARPAFARGDETILLVEDEAAVRKLTRVVLERAGYRVLEAGDGVEAQQLWEAHGSTIRLLFTDMVMPGGVSGRELAAALQKRDSTLQVVFTSGYSADMAGREFISKAGQNFIQKPSSPQHLLETIRRCLDA
jgi:CheY-like chemotaxis protein